MLLDIILQKLMHPNKYISKDMMTINTMRNKPTLGQRLQTVVRSMPNSAPASVTVLLAVRLLPGAKRMTASGVRGTVAFSTSVLNSAARAPGVDMTPKERHPSGIFT